MPTPLIATPTELAKASLGRAPHFAAALADADRNDKVVTVDTRFSRRDIASGKALMHSSTVARWAAAVAAAGAIALTVGPALTGQPVVNHVARSAEYSAMFLRANPEMKHIFKGIGERYQQLIGPPVNAHLMRTADQVVEDLTPVAPGQTSAAARHVSDVSSERGQYEIVLAAGAILGVGFENLVNSDRSNGTFEAGLVKQLVAAMKVVAPGKMLSEMTASEKQAVLTATMYSTNSSFMKIMSSQSPEFAQAMDSPEGQRIKNAVASIPSAAQFLKSFSKDGQFSLAAFNEEISTVVAKALTATGTSPTALKAKLLATIALKAEPVLQSINTTMKENGAPTMGQENPVAKYMSKMSMRVMEKIAGTEDRSAQDATDRDDPNAPNARLRDPRLDSPMRAPQPFA